LAELLALTGGSSLLNFNTPDPFGEPTKERSNIIDSVEIYAEESTRSMDVAVFDIDVELSSINTTKSSKMRMVPKSYYINIYRTKPGEKDDHDVGVLIYKSPVTSDRSAMWFRNISIRIDRLCRSEFWRPIIVELVEVGGANTISTSTPLVKGTQDLIRGYTIFTYFDLLKSQAHDGGSMVLKLVNDVGYSDRAIIRCRDLRREYSFLDYISAGLEISVIVGIDFTRSNGDPRMPSSLHAYDPDGQVGKHNEYVMVLRSVMEILEFYDSDKKFPVIGFGAKLPPSHTITSHCFACSGDYFDPQVVGTMGVLEAYRNALGVVSLHGPTRFEEILKLAKQYATPVSLKPDSAKYFILLIITDGTIEDMQKSIDEIVELSELPVSIVIVGVGKDDFGQMVFLDADETPLVSSATRKTMNRDIVQFVPFRDFKDKPYHELAVATLDEIPREVLNYYKGRGIFPLLNPNPESRSRKYIGFSSPSVGVILPNKIEDDDDSITSSGSSSTGLKFLSDQKQDLIQTVVRQGYDEDFVRRVVEVHGVMANDPHHVMDLMFHVRKAGTSGLLVKPDAGIIPISTRMGVVDTLSTIAGKSESPSKSIAALTIGRTGRLCGICLQNQIDVSIVPCGHQVVCEECLKQLPPVCPLCRSVIDRYEVIQ
jgi:hypothetical protein